MTDRDRCTDTNPHPAHRTQYGGFGLKDCPGVPMTSREELREERVTTGRLEGDLRSQTRAVREALAERDEALEDRDLLRAENANLTAGLRTAQKQRDEALDDRDQARRERDRNAADLQAIADTNDQVRQELGAAGEVLAVVRDAVERIDRALATYDTTPGESDAAPSVPPRRGQEDDLSDRLASALAAVMRSHTGADVSVASWGRWEALLAEHAERQG